MRECLYRYAHHRRAARTASMEERNWLECVHYRPVFVLRGFQAIHRLMLVRIELLADGIDSFHAKLVTLSTSCL